MADPNEQVKAVLESLIGDGPEIGLQVAAYLDGKQVVDTWAGVADPDTGRKVDGETLFMVSSVTKGMTATAVAKAYELGKLDYDDLVVKYWPEFGAHGKEKTLVRHIMAQQSGVPMVPVGYSPDWLTDWDKMIRGIADLTPMYEAGKRTSYASLTYGHMAGEILRRATGRPIERFFREEIAEPLGLDVWMGVPDSELPRVAKLTNSPADASWYEKMIGEPANAEIAEWFNRPEILKSVVPGSGGVMNARGIARMYAMLANGGELDGVRILKPETIHTATRLQGYEVDELYGVRIRRALGYRLGPDTGPNAPPETAFGHVGGGGNFGYCDPAKNFSMGLAKNYFVHRLPAGMTAPRLTGKEIGQAVTKALGV